jgi:hypothetical protein
MSSRSSRWSNRALNLALLVLGVAAAALLYALVSQSLGPEREPPPESSAKAGAAPPEDEDAPASSAASSKTPAAAEKADSRTAGADLIEVGIRNGCGEPGLAARTRDYLVRAGFDVVEVGNYSSFDVDSSMVIHGAGNRAAARRAARALGIPVQRVRQEVDAAYYVDASVVLGSDYATLAPFRSGNALPNR